MQKRRGRPVAAGGGRGAVQPAQTIASAASAAHVRPPRDRPSDSRLGLAADFLSFDPAPCVQIQGCEDLLSDIGGQQVAGTGGMLVSADHTGVDPDRPPHALGHIGVATELVEDPHPGTVG